MKIARIRIELEEEVYNWLREEIADCKLKPSGYLAMLIKHEYKRQKTKEERTHVKTTNRK